MTAVEMDIVITVPESALVMMVSLEMTVLDWNVPRNAMEMGPVITILESALAKKDLLEMTVLE